MKKLSALPRRARSLNELLVITGNELTMNQMKMRIIALFLSLCLVLTGCNLLERTGLKDLMDQIQMDAYTVSYSDMEYVRPDPTAIQTALDACIESADAEDFSVLEEALYAYMDLNYDFYTNYSLADIRYCCDLTDIYWTDEYNYCMEQSPEISAGIDQLMYVLADSPHREILETDEYYGEDYFDDYEGESIWDETFTALMEEEADLISEYYDLSAQLVDSTDTDSIYIRMADLLAELIALRQDIAAYVGYESFHPFAYDFYYARDYSPEQEAAYLQQVKQELVPLYDQIAYTTMSDLQTDYSSAVDTFAYVREMANAMGGTVKDAFHLLDTAGLYDITYSDNKYNASFEVYLYSYGEPFIFINPSGTTNDHLTFAHEFGHFCNDYASYGSMAGVDIAEIFSQGMEYLSLFYCEDTEMLTKIKMVDSLCVFVEQSAYAEFERRAYGLEGDALTGESLITLFGDVAMEYGFGDLGDNKIFFTQITHFYTNPMYVFSYVVSNDAAMQLYQLEQSEAGAGLAALEANLAITEEIGFLAFLQSAQLESPFAEGRVKSLRATFEDILK